jgi:hypothetical protein
MGERWRRDGGEMKRDRRDMGERWGTGRERWRETSERRADRARAEAGG